MSNTDELEKIIQRMQKAANSLTSDRFALRDQAIADLLSYGDPSVIEPILLTLRDDDDFHEEMFTLVHAAESFNDRDYVEKLLNCIEKLEKVAPGWASVLIMRAANSDACRDEIIANLKQKSIELKNSVLRLCAGVKTRNTNAISNIKKLSDQIAQI